MERPPHGIAQTEVERLQQEIGLLQARLAEKELEREEQQKRETMYRQAISASRGVVYQLDFRHSRYLFLDEGIERLIGYSASEVTPVLWSDIGSVLNWRGDLQGVSITEAIRLYRTGEIPVWAADYVCRTRQGEVRWISDHSVPLRDEEGQIYGCLGILQDITERKSWDEALRESEQRFRSLLETIQLIAVLLDNDGNITFVNEHLLRVTGFQEEAVIGQNWFTMFIPAEERDAVKESFARKIEVGTIAPQDENAILTAQGETRRVSWNNTVIHDAHGRIVGTASIGVDITERKRMEEQLFQAQKMESIGRLAGGVAHDFNNLLTAILGYAELAKDELPPNSDVLLLLGNIQQAGEQAADLTAQLLAFARKQIIAPKSLDLNTVLHDTEKILRRLIGEHIALVCHPGENLGLVRADSNQIQQVLLNLAINARDAMPEGGHLIIETAPITLDAAYARQHTEVRPGEYVCLTVTDTGVGMDAGVQQHIFEPFFTTKGVGKGTGLGLATCHGIVRQNDGHIWVYSEPGHGTTFRVYLPRLSGTAAPTTVAEKPAAIPGGSETILLVEDEDMVREFAEQALSVQGYRVLTARNGPDALRFVEGFTETIHLLLTDVVMPQMSGSVLAARLRELRPDIKVLYTTGYTENTIVHHGVLEVGILCLPKPYQVRTLAQKVRDVLDAAE